MLSGLRILFIVLILLGLQQLYGQKRNNVWIFGNRAGLDFNTIPPTTLDSTMVGSNEIGSFNSRLGSVNLPPYYVSSICDTSGQLLFYTDGKKIWNGKNEEIPKYLHRWPWLGFVMPLICPYPDNDSLYYLFGVSTQSYANRLQYLTINIKGNGGKGEIVYPQPSTISNYYTILLRNASVLIAGTVHCNQKDTWIVTHSNDAWYSFLVTAKGVDTIPVVSLIAPELIAPQNLYGGYGNIKFSANGEKMVVPIPGEKKMVIFDFNNSTGQFSNPIELDISPTANLEDVELSPDGGKLYYGSYEIFAFDDSKQELHDVFQMDLNAGTADAIGKTLVKLSPYPQRALCGPNICYYEYRTLQLAPDGKIYVSMLIADIININVTASVIQNPNEAGINAWYKLNAVNLKRKYAIISYNYIRSQSFTVENNGIQVQKATCADKPASFSLLYSRIDSVKWEFGDPASGNNNYSRSLKSQHTYPSPGTYYAKAIIYESCSVDTAVAQVNITEDVGVHISPAIKDTIVCVGNKLVLNATTPNATNYFWNNGIVYPEVTITADGKYAITAYNACSIDRRDFTVKYENCNCNIFVPTAFTPNDDGLNDLFRPTVHCFANEYRFSVYNRYGAIVFMTTNQGVGWNGNISSMKSKTDTFVWTLQYRNPNNKQLSLQRGTVVLIR